MRQHETNIPGRIVDGFNEFLQESALLVQKRTGDLVSSADIDVHWHLVYWGVNSS